MRYRIEYCEGRCHNYANGRKDIFNWLKILKDEVISDIVKEYENGAEVSVLDKYKKYIKKEVK